MAPRVRSFGFRALLVVALALVPTGCGGHEAGTTARAEPDRPERQDPDKAPTTGPPGSADGPVTVLAAGDIASCESEGDERTAALLGRTRALCSPSATTAYDRGEPSEFTELLRADLGPRTGPHAAGARQPRVRHAEAPPGTSTTSAPRPGDPGKG